jgi:hypothetical protein
MIRDNFVSKLYNLNFARNQFQRSLPANFLEFDSNNRGRFFAAIDIGGKKNKK